MITYIIVLFVWFLIAMFFLRRRHQLREKLGPFFYVLVMIVVGGIPLDFFFQWCPILGAPMIFREFTPDWMFSGRMSRYRDNPKYKGTWKMRWADWICEHLLNPYDPSGHHC